MVRPAWPLHLFLGAATSSCPGSWYAPPMLMAEAALGEKDSEVAVLIPPGKLRCLFRFLSEQLLAMEGQSGAGLWPRQEPPEQESAVGAPGPCFRCL